MYFYPVAACRDPTRVGGGEALKLTSLCCDPTRVLLDSVLIICVLALQDVALALMGSVFDTNQQRRDIAPGKLRNAGVR